jgi:hypothetical protein
MTAAIPAELTVSNMLKNPKSKYPIKIFKNYPNPSIGYNEHYRSKKR